MKNDIIRSELLLVINEINKPEINAVGMIRHYDQTIKIVCIILLMYSLRLSFDEVFNLEKEKAIFKAKNLDFTRNILQKYIERYDVHNKRLIFHDYISNKSEYKEAITNILAKAKKNAKVKEAITLDVIASSFKKTLDKRKIDYYFLSESNLAQIDSLLEVFNASLENSFKYH